MSNGAEKNPAGTGEVSAAEAEALAAIDEQMAGQASPQEGIEGFGAMEIDAIGEIENITMGSAATAASNLLNAKVNITTPRVRIIHAKELSYPNLEPSVHVKIEYIQGIEGSSILVLKQSDVQLILNQLMGQPLVVTDDFEFDEMNISAVCEVMNQMMGASATALADLLGTPVDISTPVASVSEADAETNDFPATNPDDYVVVVGFDLTIDGVIKSEFISVLSIDLAKEMTRSMLGGFSEEQQSEPAPAPAPAASSGGTMSQEEIEKLMGGGGAAAAPAPAAASSGGMMSQEEIEKLMGGGAAPAPAPAPGMAPQQPMAGAPPYPQQPAGVPAGMPPYPYPPMPGMPGYDPNMAAAYPYGYPQPGMPGAAPGQMPGQMPGYYPQQVQHGNAVNIQQAQLHTFESFDSPDLTADENNNLKLLMGVPLDVTVEIGSTKRKVKEILDFTQGTIIELERQAGAPVDVIVNGHLIARGDVVVIEDNFAVRITEIIKSKFLDSLGNKE